MQEVRAFHPLTTVRSVSVTATVFIAVHVSIQSKLSNTVLKDLPAHSVSFNFVGIDSLQNSHEQDAFLDDFNVDSSADSNLHTRQDLKNFFVFKRRQRGAWWVWWYTIYLPDQLKGLFVAVQNIHIRAGRLLNDDIKKLFVALQYHLRVERQSTMTQTDIRSFS